MANDPQHMIAAIERAIQQDADRLREQMITLAVKDFEKQLRERVGQCAVSVASFYTVEYNRGEIRIAVKIGEPAKATSDPLR